MGDFAVECFLLIVSSVEIVEDGLELTLIGVGYYGFLQCETLRTTAVEAKKGAMRTVLH